MPLKILTLADLHLGRTSSGTEVSGADASTRSVWLQAVDWAVRGQVDAVVVAGDVVDQENKFFEAVSALEPGLRKLNNAGITVIMTAGNHDFDVLPRVLAHPVFDKIHFLGKDGKWELLTLNFGGQNIQFAGWSFPASHHREDPFRNFPADELNPDIPVIGVVHGEFGAQESVYAPLNPDAMKPTAADVWILGHIHKPEILHPENPLIYYPGSPQALSPKETGRHGGVLLTLSETGRIHHEWKYFSSVRYEETELDVSWVEFQEDIPNLIVQATGDFLDTQVASEEKFLKNLVLDVVLTGEVEQISVLEDNIKKWNESAEDFRREQSGIRISVRKISHRCSVKITRLEELSKEPSPAGMLAQAVLDLRAGSPSEFLNELRKNTRTALGALNSSGVYLPLRSSRKVKMLDAKEDVDAVLLQECSRLLSLLLQNKGEGV